jgi:TetR/AcrR family transcriptional regulator
MPKQTFFNLPDEKRQHILNTAIDEFADNDFGDVSISRIVERAGIAKGSFYQYFEDKEDLHGYLLDLFTAKKIEMLSIDHPDPQHVGIFAYLRWLIEGAVALELAYPKLVRIVYRSLNHASIDEITARYRQESQAFYRSLVALGKAQGDIDPDVDEELAAYFFESMFTSMGKYVAQYLNVHLDSSWRGEQPYLEIPEIKRIYEQAIHFLEQGMGARSRVAAADGGRQAAQRPHPTAH